MFVFHSTSYICDSRMISIGQLIVVEINSIMSGRSLPLYYTLTLIAMQVHQTKKQKQIIPLVYLSPPTTYRQLNCAGDNNMLGTSRRLCTASSLYATSSFCTIYYNGTTKTVVRNRPAVHARRGTRAHHQLVSKGELNAPYDEAMEASI